MCIKPPIQFGGLELLNHEIDTCSYKLNADDTTLTLRLQVKKTKNVSHDPFGSKMGRIHMTKQDLGELQLRKVKALKKSANVTDGDSDGATDEKRARTDDSPEESLSETMEFEQTSDADESS